MAQRQSVRRIDTPAVQGDDSFIVVSRVTLDEALERDRLLAAGTYDQEKYMRETLARHVLDWNWVDDDNEPLPKPRNNPGVFGRLTDAEMDVLSNAIVGRGEGERKNSATASEPPSGQAADATSQQSTLASSSAESTAAGPAS